MTSSNRCPLDVDRLEDRVVPDASSALDPDFFSRLNFEAYDQANQRQADTVRVFTGLYQQGQSQIQAAEQEIQNQQNQISNDAQSQIQALTKAFQDFNKQLEDRKNAIQDQYKEKSGAVQNQAQEILNNLAKSGLDANAMAQQGSTILAWTRAQYEGLTAEANFKMQEVQTAYGWLQQAQKDQYAGIVNAAIAKFNQLQSVHQQLLAAYDANNVALLNQLQNQMNLIQQDLIRQLNDIQNAWINYSELVTQQQLYQSYDYSYPYYDYGGTGYLDSGGGGGGGGSIFFDDNAPKGGP